MVAIFGKKDEKKPKAAKAEVSDKAPAPKGALAREHAGRAYRVLLRPVYSEKASRQQALGQYVFIVSPDTNKVEVAAAIRDLYGVKPVAVRILKLKGKVVRFGHSIGQRKDEKKAIVTLKSGDSIALAEA